MVSVEISVADIIKASRAHSSKTTASPGFDAVKKTASTGLDAVRAITTPIVARINELLAAGKHVAVFTTRTFLANTTLEDGQVGL